MKRIIRPLILAILVAGGAYYWYLSSRPVPLVLTGIVTTNEVVVSPQIAGRIAQLTVEEGDQVKADQMIGVLESGEGCCSPPSSSPSSVIMAEPPPILTAHRFSAVKAN